MVLFDDQLLLEGRVGIDGEVSRHHGETSALLDVGFEEVPDAAAVMVVPDARAYGWGWHSLLTGATGAGQCVYRRLTSSMPRRPLAHSAAERSNKRGTWFYWAKETPTLRIH